MGFTITDFLLDAVYRPLYSRLTFLLPKLIYAHYTRDVLVHFWGEGNLKYSQRLSVMTRAICTVVVTVIYGYCTEKATFIRISLGKKYFRRSVVRDENLYICYCIMNYSVRVRGRLGSISKVKRRLSRLVPGLVTVHYHIRKT